MYGWDEDPSTWYGKGRYSFEEATAHRREADAGRARAEGPRSYGRKSAPDPQRTDPKKKIRSHSENPLIVAVDVTGSMAQWPFEIFDRLPLLYNTLSQYRPDLDIAFFAIGDERADRFPIQVTDFASGFDLEAQLKALYGEGGGGDIPESYGLLAWYVANRCEIPNAKDKPFFILFGDAPMHTMIGRQALQDLLGVSVPSDVTAFEAWRRITERWNLWFLRRPTGREGDGVDEQWRAAIGADNVLIIEDEARAVDCAMGIVARAWGRLEDFENNLLARQSAPVVERVATWIQRHGPRALECPKCAAPIPAKVFGRYTCAACGATLVV